MFWKNAIIIVTYLSTAFAFALYNKAQCVLFYEKKSKEIFSEIVSLEMLFDLIFTVIFFGIFTVELVSPIAFISALLSNLLTFIFARSIWLKSMEKENPTRFFTVKLIIHYVASLPGLFLLFLFASSFIPSIPTLLMVARIFSYTLIIPLIASVFLYIRAFIKMHSFIKRLKKYCKDKKVKLPYLKHPYLSVIKAFPDNTFEIEINGRIYACNLLSYTNIFRPVVFKADGYYYRISARNLKQKIKPSLFFETRYGYENKSPKLCIITNEPYVIMLQEGNHLKNFDTGDICGDYKLFTPNGFFGAAERDTIHRKNYD